MKNFKTWYIGWVLGIIITVLMYEFAFPNSGYMNKSPKKVKFEIGQTWKKKDKSYEVFISDITLEKVYIIADYLDDLELFFNKRFFRKHHKLVPQSQEIKVGSIVVLGEDGSMIYCNPEDLDEKDIKLGIVKVDIIPTCDTINLKAGDYITLEGKVSGINTKDINPAPPMQSIKIIKRIVSGDSVRYYVPNDFK